ncbi:MAG: Hsp33 family molecular chaperone HslO [Chloroflexota bacterium]
MDDYLLRVWSREAGVRGLICITTHLVNEGVRRHQASPTAAAALGRALTGGVLIGGLLKIAQRVAVKFEGSGPLKKLIVESDSNGVVRGYVQQPLVDLPQTAQGYDVVGAIGAAGLLTVVKDVGLRDLAQSVIPLATSTIDGDLTAYLEQSEQIASVVQVGSMVDEAGYTTIAGGILLQAMPPRGADVVQLLRERMQEMPPIEVMLATGRTPEQVASELFGELVYVELEKRPLIFQCSCSRERSEKALLSLGRAEIELLLEEGEAVIDCHFCHERYVFDRDELEILLGEMPE